MDIFISVDCSSPGQKLGCYPDMVLNLVYGLGSTSATKFSTNVAHFLLVC
jgi:hypothetical protein